MASKAEKPEGIWELFKTVFWALIIAGVFRTLFFQPFWIPSGSMKDTLLIGDFLFVNKMAYGYSQHSCPFSACPISGRILGSEPVRGDVVVFRHPKNGQDFIKRLIGLPGDKIQMKDSVVHINGQAVQLTQNGVFEEVFEPQGSVGSKPRCENNPGLGAVCEKSRMTETLPNGVSHDILNIADQAKDHTGIYTVPDGEYFFMGDNRDNSTDSRYAQNAGGVGFVPYENIIGRADRIMFSSAGKSLFYFWTWRSDRFFKAVQ